MDNIEIINPSEDDLVREYVGQLENNTAYWIEQCAIYQTQKELARSKVSFLEMKVFQLEQIILQYQKQYGKL